MEISANKNPGDFDAATLSAYDKNATVYVDDWLNQPSPTEIHALIRQYFHKQAATCDVGCGSGREVAWLNSNGYPTIGFDASEGLLRQAQKRFPKYSFQKAVLPALNEIESGVFKNVLCETVLMHLPSPALEPALRSLFRILQPRGILQLSWRLPRATSVSEPTQTSRETDGRLYSLISFEDVLKIATNNDAICHHQSEIISPSSGKVIRQMLLQKK